jgi:putative radical SAM enzyme (TIGR03279 family)
VEHPLDFSFFTATDRFSITVVRRGRKRTLHVFRQKGASLDVEFAPVPIRHCANRCLFCFIDQLPPGMRKSLYIKDEDYRHSFLHGNYITMSTLSDTDIETIVELGLSPLYVSVHATDHSIRGTLLGNRRSRDIMEALGVLAHHGIHFHTQIVVCPGINDGVVLKKTISDLFTFGDALESIAVVPVGLTRFHRGACTPVSPEHAARLCTMVNRIGDRAARRDGVRRVFVADELFLRSGQPIPPSRYYEQYPQIENGVGLVRQTMNEYRRVFHKYRQTRAVTAVQQKQICHTIVVTAQSAQNVMQRVVTHLQKLAPEIDIELMAIENDFFGRSVTVAGLLTGRDIIRRLKAKYKKRTQVIVPDVIFNYRGYTLDGYSAQRIEKAVGMKIFRAGSIRELVDRAGA